MHNDLLTRQSLRQSLPTLQKNLPPGCKIRANNDVEAIERWLDEYFDKATTFRSYKKEAERFLIWCMLERETTLFKLDREDVEAYITFLKDPQPREKWCGPRHFKSKNLGEKIWYPFAKPLSPSAINTALAILNSLLSYLVDARYLDFNPFVLVRRKSRFKSRITEQNLSINERILQDNEWEIFLQTMNSEPENTIEEKNKKNRLIFLVNILFFLGLRIDELVHAKWADFKNINQKWWFFVRGKGDRLGKIPVNGQLFKAILNYRHNTGRAPVPSGEPSPILPTLKNLEKNLTSRQISNLIKNLATKVAANFEHDQKTQEKFLRFSPHWLRHLSASRQDALGVSFTNIKNNLRHQNEQTTRQYVHSYDDNRHQEMEKLRF